MPNRNFEDIPGRVYSQVISAIIQTGAKKATKYIDPKTVVKATRRHKLDGRSRTIEFVVTVGRPNYLERKFIADCKKAGEPFPVRDVQLKFDPKKKK